MGKRGAQAFEPNWEDFDKLCAIQCTIQEIASYYNVSERTIKRTVKRVHGVKFVTYFRQKRKTGHISLRRKMFELALAGDKTMLIWLSKQHLKFSEKMTVREPKNPDAPPPAQDTNAVKLLEVLLSELKPKSVVDENAKMLAIAKRLGIEK